MMAGPRLFICLFGMFYQRSFLRRNFFWSLLCGLSEKVMATHSSTLAWKIPWMEEPGGLQSMGSHRVGHDWVTSLSLFTFMHWRRKWQPTPVFLPGESQGRWSLVACRLWGRTESDTTDVTAAAAKVITKRNSDKSLNQGKPNPWTLFSAKKLLKDWHLENREMNQKKEFRNEDAAVK